MRKRKNIACSLLSVIVVILLIAAKDPVVKVYLIGDSTVCDQDIKRYPVTGWGTPFADYFRDNVQVKNHAKGGRSTRTFIEENRWQPVVDSLKAGDYVLMQFGHNDEAKEPQYAARYTSVPDYKRNLIRFITETRAKQAYPILVTPVSRRVFKQGKAQETHVEYTAAVFEVGKALGVPVIDLDRKSRLLYDQLGEVKSKRLFMELDSAEHPIYPLGRSDNTHFNDYGARIMAEMVLNDIRAQQLPLGDLIVNGTKQQVSSTKQQVSGIELTVAQDGSGDYKTIQEAVNSVRDHMQFRVLIHIKEGIYHEKLVIPAAKKNIALIGDSKDKTIITNADYSGKNYPGKDPTGNLKYSTYTSFTVLVLGNDCVLENLTIENASGTVGQAVALHVEADRFAAKNCAFIGNQDTLYTSKDGRNYFESCLIVGTTDFIFGEATAVFSRCTIRSLSNSYITAASTTKEQKFGYVFLDCNLIAAAGVNEVYLGRPWRPFAKTVFIRTQMGHHIIGKGWHAWPGDPLFADKEKTAYYAEYANSGPGTVSENRVSWSKQLTKKQAKMYTLKNIFGSWIPSI